MAINAETLRMTNANYGRHVGWMYDMCSLDSSKYRIIDPIHSWFKRNEQGWVQSAVKIVAKPNQGWSQTSLVLWSSEVSRVSTFKTGALFTRNLHLVLAETLNETAPRILEDTGTTAKWVDRYLKLDPENCNLNLPYFPVQDITVRPFITKHAHLEMYRSWIDRRIHIRVHLQDIEEDPSQIIVVVTALNTKTPKYE